MDCSTSDGGLRLGGRSGLCRSRSRSRLWQGSHPTASRDGHSRPTNCTAIALTERLCRTPDWLDQAGGTRHVVVLGERHLRHVLLSYMAYHNQARTHLSPYKDAPIPRE